MKQYIKALMLSGVLAGTAACTDLDTPIVGYYPQFPDSEIATAGEFDGCYYFLRNEAWLGRNFWEGILCQGDEIFGICYGTDSYFDNGRWFYPSIHKLNPDVPGVGLIGEVMRGITYTNPRILAYGGPDGKDPVVAPLRAIRAFYHFWMMELYGDFPILDHVVEEGEVIDRQPRADVARWIEQELLEVIPDLSEANDVSTYGRPNKWMAEALLAKLYINWGVYTNDIETVTGSTPNEKLDDCVKWCDEIIKSGIFEVGNGYRKKFFPDNGVHIKDFIYAMPMDPATFGGGVYWAGHEIARFSGGYKDFGCLNPAPWTWIPSSSIACNMIMTPEAVDRFCLEGDERNEMVQCGQAYRMTNETEGYKFTDEPVIVYRNSTFKRERGPLVYQKTFEFDNIDVFSVGLDNEWTNLTKGARLMKYPAREEDYLSWSRKQTNDIPIFRYADILLMKAECILRGAAATNGDTPASLMNQVRDCSNAPHVTGTPTLQDLLDERSREFIFEMWRRNDLIRFGQFENDWGWKHDVNPGAKTEYWRRLLPIPTGEMNTNTNWKQNKGY
ncbi:MAG: RagB/SusD family nutrient uptake outer membrane protein [Duncaniella sp.]|nr:RagB/SusD family nutrient uptake outer membrane protein [Duncaniella sp.]